MRFAAIGDPVAHSKSPAMHRAAYAALGMDHTYEAIRATAEDLPGLVEALRRGEYDGFNVTVPHKQRILSLADAVSPNARALDAANTLLRDKGRVVAENTDAPALVVELRMLATGRSPEEWKRSAAIVLGSGGAARAARAALEELGVETLVTRARRGFDPLAPTELDARALTIVQATSAGMTSADPGDAIARAIDWNRVPREAVALDVIYAPPETPFLAAAKARGLRHANGLGMLVEQGAIAFELWLGKRAPHDVMLAAIR